MEAMLQNTLSREVILYPSYCGSDSRLGLYGAFRLFMDLASEHAEALGNGVPELMERGLFWVAVKTRLRFTRRPKLMERVTASTWPEPPGKLRNNRDYRMTAGDEVLAVGKTEFTILDWNTGGLHSPREAVYVPGLEFSRDLALPEPFHRFLDEGPWEPWKRYTVKSTDIDMGGHMNNAAYVRMLQELFTTEEWTEMDPTDLEIHYRASAYEGNELQIQRRSAEGALELRATLPDGTLILLVRII